MSSDRLQQLIVTEWTSIVGEQIAASIQPMRLARSRKGGACTLYVRVASKAALEIQIKQSVICDRVNDYLGYHVVGRLRLGSAIQPAMPDVTPPDPAAG
jgi:hypothetical protein